MQTSWLPSTLKEIRSVAKSKKLYNLGHREVYFHILPATESSFNGCPLVSTSLNVMETNIATSLHRMMKNLDSDARRQQTRGTKFEIKRIDGMDDFLCLHH